jgi:CheY-like chemotaxis protein
MLRQLRRSGFDPEWTVVQTRQEYEDQLGNDLDVILADYVLPDFDALSALELLHERDIDVPFIVVTGNIGEETAARCIKQGASDYLLKDRLERLGDAAKRA